MNLEKNVSVIETKQNSAGLDIVRYGFENRDKIGLSVVSLRQNKPFFYDICVYDIKTKDVFLTDLFPYQDQYCEGASQEDLDKYIKTLSSDKVIKGLL